MISIIDEEKTEHVDGDRLKWVQNLWPQLGSVLKLAEKVNRKNGNGGLVNYFALVATTVRFYHPKRMDGTACLYVSGTYRLAWKQHA
jgi:hypothetical protein